jgi:transposase
MATQQDVPASIRQFAEGLKNDWAAVTAALTFHWNNGSAEGHISRLKMIKRQMYGRANFDLLRARFLFAS